MGVGCAAAQPSGELPVRYMRQRERGFTFLNNSFSHIKLVLGVATLLPSQLKDKFENYSIIYKIKYGKQEYTWTEYSETMEHKSQRPCDMHYLITLKDQMLHAEVEFKPADKGFQNLINDIKNVNEYSEIKKSSIVLKAEYDMHDLIMANGEFRAPVNLDAQDLRDFISHEETKSDPLEGILPPLLVSVKESKPENLKKIRFRVRGKFKRKNKVLITIYEVVGNNRKFIYETAPMSHNSQDPTTLYYDPIEINTDVFEGDIITTKIIELEAKEVIINNQGNITLKSFATTQVRVKEVISLLEGEVIDLALKNKSNKTVGNIIIGDATIQPVFTFLDYKIHRCVNIVPIIAIDYSLSNLTFDDQK